MVPEFIVKVISITLGYEVMWLWTRSCRIVIEKLRHSWYVECIVHGLQRHWAREVT